MNQHTEPQRIRTEQVAELLTRAAAELDDDTVAALRKARHIALERQTQHRYAFASGTAHGIRWLAPHTPHQWVATTILLAAVLAGGIGYWQHVSELKSAHLDVAILTDELPLEVFVDR